MTRKKRSQSVAAATPAIEAPQRIPWHMRWARRAIFALLILLPLAVLSPDLMLPNPTDMPRRLLLALVAGLLLAGVLWGWARNRRVSSHFHLLDIPVLLFFFGALCAGILGAYPHVSLLSVLWTQEFTALPALGIGVALYFGVKEFINGRASVEDAGFIMVMAGGVEACIALIDHFGQFGLHPAFSGSGPDSAHRLVGTLGNPMFTGTFFAMLIPLALGIALGTAQMRRRPWLLIGVVLMTFALLLTQTRSAWLGLAITLVLFAVLALWRRQAAGQGIAPVVPVTALLVIVVVLGLGMLLPQLRARLVSISNPHDMTRVTRVVYMTAAWRMFHARPVTGWGPGTLRQIFPQFRPSTNTVFENGLPLNRGYSASLPHNWPLQIAAEMGLCGLLPFAALLIVLLVGGGRLIVTPSAPGWLGLGLLGLLFANLLSNLTSYDNAATMGLFWIGLSLFAALSATERPLLASCPFSPALLRGAATTLAIVVVLAVLAQTLDTVSLASANDKLSRLTQDPEAAQHSREAVDDIRTALTLVPLRDHTAYAFLTAAYRAELGVYAATHPQAGPNDATFTSLHDAMFKAGEQTLQVYDREPQVQRILLIAASQEPGRYAEADTICQRLILHEPNSSEVRLLAAQLLENEGKMTEALQQVSEANRIDASNPEIAARRAHLHWLQHLQDFIKDPAPWNNPQLKEMAADYQHTLDALGYLLDANRQEYAVVLFLLRQTPQAIEQGQCLASNIPGRDNLCDNITKIGMVYHRDAEASAAVQQIRTAPSSSPAPTPTISSPADLLRGH